MEDHLHVSLISSRLDKSMVAMGNSCFWLAEIYKIFSSETRRHSEWLLCMNDVWEILFKISIFRTNHTTQMASSCLWQADWKNVLQNHFDKLMEICRKHLWKVLHKCSSKQNDRWTTQAQPAEPLILCVHCIVICITAFDYHLSILDFSSYVSAVIILCSFFF